MKFPLSLSHSALKFYTSKFDTPFLIQSNQIITGIIAGNKNTHILHFAGIWNPQYIYRSDIRIKPIKVSVSKDIPVIRTLTVEDKINRQNLLFENTRLNHYRNLKVKIYLTLSKITPTYSTFLEMIHQL